MVIEICSRGTKESFEYFGLGTHFFGNLFTKVGFMVYFVESSKPEGKFEFLLVS